MALFVYYALLLVWPLIVWPALRVTGRSRAWLWLALLAGLLATVREIHMLTGTPSAIRLDIPLIAAALCLLYGVAAAVAFRRRWRMLAAGLFVVILLAGGGMAYSWIQAGRESERLSEAFHARNALLFEAKFRNLDTYASYFRTFDARPSSYPVGHWEPQGESYFARLIVNPEGRVWAFYRCGETECAYRSAGPGLQPLGDPGGGRWEATLRPPVGAPVSLRIVQSEPERLTLEGRGQPTGFIKTLPPIDPAPARESLIYLGPFRQVECRGRHAAVRQLWLWQEDTRLYAVAIISTLLAGGRADFVSPIVLGEGSRRDGSWSFAWKRNGQVWRASISLEGPEAMLELQRDGEAALHGALARGALFRDEAIELAPLTSEADWNRWFDIVLVGHFSSGDIPVC